MEARLQRYAKLRMWTEGRNWPWEEASDVALPDIMTHSLRIQDTLHNAVMSIRPAINSKAVSGKEDLGKQEKIDNLIDFQVFVENEGEKFIGECADAFVNDGVMTIYVPWVREDRDVIDIRIFPAIQEDFLPVVYFKQILTEEFPKGLLYKKEIFCRMYFLHSSKYVWRTGTGINSCSSIHSRFSTRKFERCFK